MIPKSGNRFSEKLGLHPVGETGKLGTGCWNLREKLGSSSRRQICLKLDGRSIGERRVQALTIVDLLQEVADGRACLGDIAISSAIDFFVFERLHEAFRLGVVIWTADMLGRMSWASRIDV